MLPLVVKKIERSTINFKTQHEQERFPKLFQLPGYPCAYSHTIIVPPGFKIAGLSQS
jgi:hypothetical protein